MKSWYDLPEPKLQWLVDGLIPADGHTAVVGKPKAGKSTFIRNLIASVVKSRKFLGRSVDLPNNSGRVFYLHLDRKDQDWRVARDLRALGIEKDDSSRVILRTAAHMTATTFEERLVWLREQVADAKPNLVVIDLLWQFVRAKNSNDYNAVLDGINTLQDTLRASGYKGALVVAIHGRKAVSATDQFDDILGSTGQRGSFSTIIMLTNRRSESVYTISSDQTERDDTLGEIPETVISRTPDGTLQLGQPIKDLLKQEKHNRFESDLQRFFQFVENHPGVEMDAITQSLGMSKKYALQIFAEAKAFVRRDGSGIKGDPFKYFPLNGGTHD
jgi:RecA-family ATPase